MCGRFAITLPTEAMVRLFQAEPAHDLPPSPRYNVCPTQTIAAVALAGGRRRLGPMRWGFLPRWYKTPGDGPLLFNARAETIAEKPAFREAARARRCLVPATGFYEWTRGVAAKEPWFIRRADGAPLVMAGIWQVWQGEGDQRLTTCAIVTAQATGGMAALHDRVPVVLEPGDWALWLGEAGPGAAQLMRAPAEGVLTWHRVGPAVNSSRAEGPELIAPVAG